jgi:hypothetical protein
MRAPLQEKREDDIMDWGHNMVCWGLTTATGDDDNDIDGDGAMGKEVDDGDGATGNEVDDDGDGATGDDNDDDDDGDGDGTMGSGATGYDDDADGDGQRQ